MASVKVEPETLTSAGDMILDSVEEEDEVVREIDVFLSPELSNQLYLMQFPLQRQQHRTTSAPLAARVRTNHCMIELDYPTHTSDGSGQEYNGQFHMATRTYSSQTIPISTHMALGKLVPSEDGGSAASALHLVPLTRIAQMRPNFNHVNEATLQTSSSALDDDDAAVPLDASSSSRKPLTFQKKESERAALARKSSYSYKKASEDSEMWLSLDVYGEESGEYQQAIEKLPCPTPEQNLLTPSKNYVEAEVVDVDVSANGPGQFQGPLSSYVQSLNYLPQRFDATAKEAIGNDGADMLTNVVTKMVELMQLGLPIPFKVLRTQFDSSISNTMMFSALENCAFLVRGNFVLQSRLLPLIPAVGHARTFILFLLQTLGVVYRKRLEHVYEGDDRVTSEAILMLLEQVAQRTTQGWKLKVDDDESFPTRFPAIVSVHGEYWRRQVRRYGPLLEKYREQVTLSNNDSA
eukprot:Nitzschia sp. Nitz4//scaffold11_size288233//157476//158867//NITZ4_000777-RA/size288233-processed-gene-0.181-mRNA-1//1//CDS//3329534083//9402//frame0